MPALFTPNFQRSDANGNPYSGAKLYFYASGTTTPITVYQDAALATPHSSPVVADSAGAFAEIFVNTDPFKFVLNTSGGTLIESVDAIPLNAASSLDADLTAIAALSTTGLAARTASNTWSLRTITAGNGITVTNGDGVSGNPTISVNSTGQTTVASATTTDIGAASTTDVIISGVTTITGFGTVAAGTFRRGYFSGALTLTYNATSMILPGAATIATAAGDSFAAVSLGSGNWKVLWYGRQDGSAVGPGSSMTLLGTLTTTSGATQSLTGIAAGYRQLYIEFEAVSGTSTDNPTVALSSTGGAAYGTAVTLLVLGAASDVMAGYITIGNISSAVAAAKSMLPAVTKNGASYNNGNSGLAIATNTAAVVDAIRFAWSGAGNFDAGTIRIYGVK